MNPILVLSYLILFYNKKTVQFGKVIMRRPEKGLEFEFSYTNFFDKPDNLLFHVIVHVFDYKSRQLALHFPNHCRCSLRTLNDTLNNFRNNSIIC